MTGSPPLLEVSDLSVGYGGVPALTGVSLQVPDGTPVCLLGPNGAGKTTLLRAVSGLLAFHGGQIMGGRIRYRGESLGALDAARRVRIGIAQVLEGRHVFPGLTVAENLRSGAFCVRDRRRAAELSQRVADLFPVLASRSRQRAGMLSGGEQQMLAIGRALMSDPRLLLLDEPSLGLAPLVIRSIGEALAAISARGVGVLLVEQSSALARAATRRGYLMETGSIRADGPIADLLADEQVSATYLGVRPA